MRILYDDEAVYIGVFAQDDEPGRIIVSDLKKDFNTSTSDGFSVILDTFRDERNGYRFTTNAAGAKWDAQSANEGRENNANWDGIWDVKRSLRSQSIPEKSLCMLSVLRVEIVSASLAGSARLALFRPGRIS